jgi:methyl-accepting chemotaxis protein
MENPVKKHFLKHPLFIGLIIYFVGFFVFIAGYSYMENMELQKSIDQRLHRAAESVPMILGKETMEKLLSQTITKQEYQDAVGKLTEYTNAQGLTFLYIYATARSGLTTIITSVTEEEWQKKQFLQNGDPYPDPTPTQHAALDRQTTLYEKNVNSWGVFRSVYIPRTYNGRMNYILCTDLDISFVRSEQIRNLISSSLAGLFFLLLICPLVFLIRRREKEQKDALAKEIVCQTTTICELNADLQERLQQVENQAEVSRGALEDARQANEKSREIMLRSRELAQRLVTIVKQANEAADNLAGQITRTTAGTEQQHSFVENSRGLVEEMRGIVGDISHEIGVSSQAAETARAKAKEGGTAVESVIRSVDSMREQTSVMGQDLKSLDEKAKSIGQIIGVITDIADQTNLLALNAAIEAARAGDAGRGFSVVADEVRKLAEKTKQATTEVAEAIDAIQTRTFHTIEAMSLSSEMVDTSSNLVKDAGTALEGIMGAAEASAEQARGIAKISARQIATSENLSANTDEVERISGDIRSQMQTATDIVREFRSIIEQVADIVDELEKTVV